ncbi:MAG: aminotransferase class V-fold PLP-dependent enzyme [Gemmataceae bacterium]
MLRVGHYIFKRAETTSEFEQVHRLNYQTFVNEIPQHPDTGEGQLVDKFHSKNAYFIVVENGRVIAMVSGHDEPPFSVADRLPDQSILTRPGTRPLEVRLLAIEPDKRNSTVFTGLVWSLYQHAQVHGYTHMFISGLKERVRLYRRLGFETLGPAVAHGGAEFVPMVMIIGQLPERLMDVKRRWERHHGGRDEPVCLLPGPVTTSDAVQQAFHEPPVYHRGPEFIDLFQRVRRQLSSLLGARDVALLNGSGTLANEAIAATLAAGQHAGRGLLLVNGEFGERLARQAVRFGLQPAILRWTWGQPWDLEAIDAALAAQGKGTWVWGVHQESSTGVLNDLPGLVEVAARHHARVCMDCISSLGAVPIDLSGVYLASGASGKSLGAYAGTAMIFADARALAELDLGRVPSYLDVSAAMASRGPRYTFPSPTLSALHAALEEYATSERAQATYRRYRTLGQHVREQLLQQHIEPLADEEHASPVVTTFAPPCDESSEQFVARCRSWGFEIGGQSAYLAERRLVQIATMGALPLSALSPFFDRLSHWLEQRSPVAV